MADKIDVFGEVPGPSPPLRSEDGAHQFGLAAAMALIIGSIIGAGIRVGQVTHVQVGH